MGIGDYFVCLYKWRGGVYFIYNPSKDNSFLLKTVELSPFIFSYFAQQQFVIPAKLDLGTLGYSKASVWGASNMFSFEVINQSTNDVYVGPISFRPDRGNGYLLHGFNLWSEGVFGPLQKIQQTFYVHTTDTGTISGDLLIPFYSRSAGKHDTLAVPLTGTIAQLQTPFLTGFLKSDQITGRCGTKQLHATSPLSIDLVNPTNDTLQILDISPDSINGLEMRINELISVYDSVGVLVDRLKPLSGHKTTIPTVLLPTMPAHITVEPIQFWLFRYSPGCFSFPLAPCNKVLCVCLINLLDIGINFISTIASFIALI
jgi:hypothetical protein